MKFAIVAAAILSVAVADDTFGFPECAFTKCLKPAAAKVAPNCAQDDFACICKKKDDLQTEAAPCVISKCPADVSKTLERANSICANPPPPAGGDKTTSAAPTESKPAETSSAAPGTESSAAPTETMPTVTGTAPAGTDCPPTTMVPTTTAAGNTTAPTSAPVTAGAAGMGSVGAMVAMALGALAL